MANLDIIIPVFNEEATIGPLISRIDKILRKEHIPYHIIVVDDRSTDRSLERVKKASQSFPITVLKKKGQQGKAFSILEGIKASTSDYICMIDADLQYPPEAIPALFDLAQISGVAVARRITYGGSVVRRIGSRILAFVLGKLLHGIHCDMQSGLKVFKKEITEFINVDEITPWAFDLPLLHAAKQMGYDIAEVPIDFTERENGDSKLTLLGPTVQIAKGALRLKFTTIHPRVILPDTKESMKGAGFVHKGKRFITHSTLHHSKSALLVITPSQKTVFFIILALFCFGAVFGTLFTFKIAVAILSFVYFIYVFFNFFLILRSLQSPPVISSDKNEILALKDKDLPVYSILCPLYKEAHVIPQFVENISNLDWPKSKLE
jgi:glycosyltransferase involved in cell wall biosynthesis